jgi:hypothetical protein
MTLNPCQQQHPFLVDIWHPIILSSFTAFGWSVFDGVLLIPARQTRGGRGNQPSCWGGGLTTQNLEVLEAWVHVISRVVAILYRWRWQGSKQAADARGRPKMLVCPWQQHCPPAVSGSGFEISRLALLTEAEKFYILDRARNIIPLYDAEARIRLASNGYLTNI